jgi:hypothetical protein
LSSFWIFKFDPQVITIDDLRRGNKLLFKNLGPENYDIILFLNGLSESFEAIGKVNDLSFAENSADIVILNKPRQVGYFKNVASNLPKEIRDKIMSLDFSFFLNLNSYFFDEILKTWWGLDHYSAVIDSKNQGLNQPKQSL